MRTHGRGPAFRSRATLREVRRRRSTPAPAPAGTTAPLIVDDELIAQLERAEKEFGAPFNFTRRRLGLPEIVDPHAESNRRYAEYCREHGTPIQRAFRAALRDVPIAPAPPWYVRAFAWVRGLFA